MDDISSLSTIFGVVVILGGFCLLYKGQITVGVEDTEKYNRTVSGASARYLAYAIICAGICSVAFNALVAIFVIVTALTVAWLAGSPDT